MFKKYCDRKDGINLVVGAGFSGAVIAERIANVLDEKVVIIDRKNHVAGNSFDFKDKNGISIHKYGSHIFHTNNQKVWDYINNFSSFNTYMHRVLAVIDGIETTIPFNIDTLYKVFPESLAKKLEFKLLESFQYNSKVPILELAKYNDKDLNFLADYIYEKVFLHYTVKQWGKTPNEIDGAVTARVPVMIGKDTRYFQDIYQGIPTKGYTDLIYKMLKNRNIEIRLNTDFKQVNLNDYKRIFFTGSIDEFFDYKFGMLPYRSVNFKFEEYDTEFYQKNSVVNYPDNYDFTRIHEYKHYKNEKSAKTVIAKEYSQEFVPGKNERYYPISNEDNQNLYNKYLEHSKQYPNLFFLGRLGDYKYYDMDKAVLRALNLFEELINSKEDKLKSVYEKAEEE